MRATPAGWYPSLRDTAFDAALSVIAAVTADSAFRPGERQVQNGGAHLGADALALVVPAEPGAGVDLLEYREVPAPEALRPDHGPVDEHA